MEKDLQPQRKSKKLLYLKLPSIKGKKMMPLAKNVKTLLKEIAVILIFNYYTECPLKLQNQKQCIQEREGLLLQNMLRHGVGLILYRLQLVCYTGFLTILISWTS